MSGFASSGAAIPVAGDVRRASAGGAHAGMSTAAAAATRFATPRDFSDCVHCGLCLNACPTYLELAHEPDSPRGRVYLMKALAEGRIEPDRDVLRHLDLCLGCRACEPACPSGVGYGHLIEEARAWLAEVRKLPVRESLLRRWIIGRVMTDPGLFRFSIRALRAASALGLAGLARPLMPPGFDASLWASKLRPQPRASLPATIPAVPPVRGRVALLTGCVMDGLFGEANWATARVLTREGWEVRVPRGQVCCGALTLHAGLAGRTAELVDRNCRVFDREDVDFIVTNAAGCGAALKQYGTLAAAPSDKATSAARRVASLARDVSEVLALHPLRGPFREIKARVAYHDACHLAHGQRVTAQPRRLLEQIPGLALVPLEESDVCCGSAGSYNITEPEMAARLGARKASHIRESGADIVVAGNLGCLVQIQASLDAGEGASLEVVHIVSLLDRALAQERSDAG